MFQTPKHSLVAFETESAIELLHDAFDLLYLLRHLCVVLFNQLQ
jgi:hypothetical protein